MIKLCLGCDSVWSDKEYVMCPTCSNDNKPRYIAHFNSTAGNEFVYDRWFSEYVYTSEIVERLNYLLSA